ncbi:hypothetical protein [Yoonia sp.]|uniref:hypothetical protein n=1 Tax=Yoonia sp. TaxID=2212373 RepID=UPI00391A8CD1
MKNGPILLVGALLLAACTDTDYRQRGVGFDDRSFEMERARREAALSGPSGAFTPPAPVQTMPTGGAISASELSAAGIGGTGIGGAGGGMIGTPPPAPTGSNTGISDEQSFDAVAGRETIESDAQRRQAQIAAQQQVAPQPLPDRPVATGPNIVEYALNAPNVKGQAWYSRSMLSGQSRFQRNCAAYATADDAQRDFLARGGPERDRLGLDPDGDGFACGWDPAPFQRAVRN